ncbi:hypothetical protein ACHQM5_025929 [Ranunculus cassubicifolius]
MAKVSKKAVMSVNIVLILSLLVVPMSEGFKIGQGPTTPECDLVHGTESGDTCFSITQVSNLTATSFAAINPNINCTGLFVGQWICVSGKLI